MADTDLLDADEWKKIFFSLCTRTWSSNQDTYIIARYYRKKIGCKFNN